MLLYEKKVEDVKGVYGTLGAIPGEDDELLIESEELRYKKWFNGGHGDIVDADGNEIFVVVDGEVIVPKGAEPPVPPVEPIVPIEAAQAEAEEDAALFASAVYNKSGSNQTLTRENNEYVANNYYVAVAENVPEDAEIDIDGVKTADAKLKLSVGNNTFVDDVYYYIEDEVLYVAFPVAIIEGVKANGINVFTAGGGVALPITGTKLVGEGTITQESEFIYTIDVTKRNTYIDIGLEGTTQDEPALTKKLIKEGDAIYLSYGFAKLDEKVDGVPAMGYMLFGWASTEDAWNNAPDERTTDYTIYVPNKGGVTVYLHSRKNGAIPVSAIGIGQDPIVEEEEEA